MKFTYTKYANWWNASVIIGGYLVQAKGDTKQGAKRALKSKLEQ